LFFLSIINAILPKTVFCQQAPAALPTATTAPPLFVLRDPIPSGQLAFLNEYAGKEAKLLHKDKRFRELTKQMTPGTMYHYGHDMSLIDAMDKVLENSQAPVTIRDGRFVMVSGLNGPFLHGRGMLWFDMQEGIALGGFHFAPTNGEPTPTLTVFSSQLRGTALAMGQLPDDFAQDLAQWNVAAGAPAVSPRYFIPGDGKKYVLEHDEDYCWHDENTPAPPEAACEQMNADAADADMNAAYFMSETHNKANATAWMLGKDQTTWLAARESGCGLAMTGLPCRLGMTRLRTGVLLGHPVAPIRHPMPPPRPMPPPPVRRGR
jgi:uncharacterized protein YecT (DUF1311 family)